MIRCDVVIVGGGAAGLMCAIEAGKRGRRVLVIERSDQVGKKILISGGGRCNFTNLYVAPDNFISANPHFAKSALARYSPEEFIRMVEHHGIAYHEKELGQLFCDLSAKLIVQMLVDECRQAGARIEVDCVVSRVDRTGNGFALETNRGPVDTDALVVASGGLSIPKMGATGFGYELAKRFDHSIVPTRAALVPLTFGENELAQYRDLTGIGLPVEAGCNGSALPAPCSSPIVASAARRSYRYLPTGSRGGAHDEPAAEEMYLNGWWIDSVAVPTLSSRRYSANCSPNGWPNASASWLSTAGRCANIALAELRAIAERLQHWVFHPSGTEGYRTAEVTFGGVNTDELSSATMASKKVRGLYFIGEVVDVTGHLGGFNFQWAWASGHAAGQVV